MKEAGGRYLPSGVLPRPCRCGFSRGVSESFPARGLSVLMPVDNEAATVGGVIRCVFGAPVTAETSGTISPFGPSQSCGRLFAGLLAQEMLFTFVYVRSPTCLRPDECPAVALTFLRLSNQSTFPPPALIFMAGNTVPNAAKPVFIRLRASR